MQYSYSKFMKYQQSYDQKQIALNVFITNKKNKLK